MICVNLADAVTIQILPRGPTYVTVSNRLRKVAPPPEEPPGAMPPGQQVQQQRAAAGVGSAAVLVSSPAAAAQQQQASVAELLLDGLLDHPPRTAEGFLVLLNALAKAPQAARDAAVERLLRKVLPGSVFDEIVAINKHAFELEVLRGPFMKELAQAAATGAQVAVEFLLHGTEHSNVAPILSQGLVSQRACNTVWLTRDPSTAAGYTNTKDAVLCATIVTTGESGQPIVTKTNKAQHMPLAHVKLP